MRILVCCGLSSLYVLIIRNKATANVRISDMGIEYSTPTSPKKTGRISAKPTPNMISLIIESAVDSTALPGSPFPRLRLTKAQQPSPIITAMARAMTVNGNTTDHLKSLFERLYIIQAAYFAFDIKTL